LEADRRSKATQILAEPPYGRFELRDTAQEYGGADVDAHAFILGK
jgi:hypothetical protein